MRLLVLCSMILLVLGACHRDRRPKADSTRVASDTTPLDLAGVKTDIPAAAPDTFTPPEPRSRVPDYPPAPPALLDVVERERSVSRFCFEEFGEKNDPALAGGVAMLVTVGSAGITDAHVAADSWSSRAGKPVNDCLNAKAARAWKPAPGEVRAGRYVVRLKFKPK